MREYLIYLGVVGVFITSYVILFAISIFLISLFERW